MYYNDKGVIYSNCSPGKISREHIENGCSYEQLREVKSQMLNDFHVDVIKHVEHMISMPCPSRVSLKELQRNFDHYYEMKRQYAKYKAAMPFTKLDYQLLIEEYCEIKNIISIVMEYIEENKGF